MKPKRCKVCKDSFVPRRPLQQVCSTPCALQHARAKQKDSYDRARRRIDRDRRDRVKTLSERHREAQGAFNKYIRVRDRALPCVSCGAIQGQFHAGHYRTTKVSQLRYNTWNVHKQCAQCNMMKSGNITEYRIELVRRIGEDRVLELEHNNDSKLYTHDYLKRLKRVFAKRARHLEKLRAKLSQENV